MPVKLQGTIWHSLQVLEYECIVSYRLILTFSMRYIFVGHLCYLYLVFVMLSRLFIAALWSPAGKGLTSWLLFVIFNVSPFEE